MGITIFSCTLLCGPVNTTAPEVRLALLHFSPEEKKHLWYLLEMRDGDANSPIIYARSKYRKSITYRSPWVTVTAGGEAKPRDLKAVHIITGWDAFRFDTPLKWGVTASIVVATVVYFKFIREYDDD